MTRTSKSGNFLPVSDARIHLLCGHGIGLIVVAGLLTVIGKIALGHVEEATSYGLMPLVVALSNMSVLYGKWAWDQINGAAKAKEGE